MIVLSATAGVLVESDWRPRMESHVKRGQWKSALALLQTVRAENGEVSGGTWNAVISSCARARPPAWEEALRILEMVPPEQASVKHFTSALAACNSAFGQEPQWEAALWLMDEMGARGVQADQYAVAGCLSTLGAAGRADEAVELLETCGVEPDLAMMNAAMLACARAGQTERVTALLRQLTDAGLTPNQRTHHALVLSRLRAGQLPRAMRLLERLRLRGEALPRSTFHALMRACTDDGRGADALELWWAARRAGLPPSDETLEVALGVALSQSSSWRAATAQLRQLLQRGEPEVDGADGPRVSPFAEVPDGTPALVSTRSFEAILERCVRGARESGEWSGAEAVVVAVAELRPKQLTPQLCALAIRACLLASGRRRGNAAPVASATRLLELLEGARPKPSAAAASPRAGPSWPRVRAKAYEDAIGACEASSAAGSWETALGLLREMGARQRAAPPPSAYVAALRVVAADSRWLLAISLRDELRAAHGEAPDDALNLVAQACEAAGAWTAALQAQQERPREARVATKVRALRFLSELEKAEATQGGEGGAGGAGGEAGGGSSIRSMDGAEAGVRAVAAAVRTAAKPAGGEGAPGVRAPASALRWAGAQIHSMETTRTLDEYHAALSLCERAGRWNDALALVRSLRVAQLQPTAMTMSLVTSAVAAAGQWELVLRLYRAMHAPAPPQSPDAFGAPILVPDQLTTQAAVEALSELGRCAEALALLQTMRERDELPSRTTLETVLRALGGEGVDSGAWRPALSLLTDMLRDGPTPSRKGFESVVRLLASQGESQRVWPLLDAMGDFAGLRVDLRTLGAAFDGTLVASDGLGGAELLRLHAEGVSRGLLPPLSRTSVDVHSLPPAVARGCLLATLAGVARAAEARADSDDGDGALVITTDATGPCRPDALRAFLAWRLPDLRSQLPRRGAARPTAYGGATLRLNLRRWRSVIARHGVEGARESGRDDPQ